MPRARARGLIVLLFWLLVWQTAASLVAAPVLLPGPVETLTALLELAQQGSFWQSLLTSLGRILLGFGVAAVLGVGLAALCAWSPLVASFLLPMRTLVRSTPISSIIILVLLWLQVDRVPIFIAMLTVLPIVWQGVEQGIAERDAGLQEMALAYRLPWIRRLRYMDVPSILPYFYAACASSAGFAWKACIAAEVIAKPLHSIGKNLQDAKVYLNTRELFAWSLAVVLLSLLFEKGLKLLLQKRHSVGEKHVAA